MGISFSNIVENSRTVSIPFGDDALSITYKPAALSPAHMSKMQNELDKGDDTDPFAVAHMFCSLVTGWDLLGPIGEDANGKPLVAAGKPVPCEVDYAAWLPSAVTQFIITEIAEDSAPKSKKAKSSSRR